MKQTQFTQSTENQPPETEVLLSTKLIVPRLRAPLIERPALLARLEEGLDCKLTLVSAPAGFGKTTLISQWFAQSPTEQVHQRRAWVALDAGDNDPIRFWRYIFSACCHFDSTSQQQARLGEDGSVGQNALALLNMPQPAFEAALTTFINDLAGLNGRHILVLEDYHLIVSPRVHELMLYLLDHLPETLHLMILTRKDPPLPLARLRTRHELNEIGAAELRFSREETQALLEQSLDRAISPEVIARLDERTEGWVAALRLVILALQGKDDQDQIEQFLTTFSGDHGHVLEYLVEEVLHAQPETIQDFLLKTTFLNRLTGSLCDAVTGRNDSALLLEQMERANLFLISLDGVPQWYRYHALFAEAMQHYARRRLDPATITSLYERASHWYEENGLLGDALESALAIQAYERAATLLTEIVAPQLVQNHFHTLRRWLEKLPEELLRIHPQLAMTFAISILFTSDRYDPMTHQLLEAPLRMAEERWRAEENHHKLGELLGFRSLVSWFQGAIPQAIAEARESLTLLPPDNVQWRGIALIFVGLEEMLNGRLHIARQELLEGLSLNNQANNIYGRLDTLLMLGNVCILRGELRQAARYFEQALAETEEKPLNHEQAEFRKGRALSGLALLELEWNRLDKAAAYTNQAVEIANAYGDESLRVETAILHAKVLHAQGQQTEGREWLRALAAQSHSPQSLREIELAQAQLALASGDFAAVSRWSAAPAGSPLSLIQREAEMLLAARIHLAQGQPDAALSLLDQNKEGALENGRGHHELEMLIITALAACERGDLSRAKQALRDALTLAQPEGYVRPFLEGGERLAEMLRGLLREIKHDKAEASLVAYIGDLLMAFAEVQSPQAEMPPVDAAILVEPLSAQERRVLQLLAADLSYPEIANELVVSLNTVKTHVKNIYSKLDVHSRDEARHLARQLHLI